MLFLWTLVNEFVPESAIHLLRILVEAKQRIFEESDKTAFACYDDSKNELTITSLKVLIFHCICSIELLITF